MTTDELVSQVREAVAEGALVLVLHESADEPLTKLPLPEAESMMLVIGPEGGIAEDEICSLSGAGAKVVRLGPTVLRTSTAAAVALGALGAVTARWD
jgi:16S rRNA (uracil1498-N3)-methyltransferase